MSSYTHVYITSTPIYIWPWKLGEQVVVSKPFDNSILSLNIIRWSGLYQGPMSQFGDVLLRWIAFAGTFSHQEEVPSFLPICPTSSLLSPPEIFSRGSALIKFKQNWSIEIVWKGFASLFQSVRNVTHTKMIVCINVPAIIPDHIPCSKINTMILFTKMFSQNPIQ